MKHFIIGLGKRLFGRFEKISIYANKTIVIIHLAIMTIVVVLLRILYFDLICQICNQDVIDINYLFEYVFIYNFAGTVIVLSMIGVVIYGYYFYISKRKSLFIVMYEQGLSKHMLFVYLLSECFIMFIIPYLIGDLLCFILL